MSKTPISKHETPKKSKIASKKSSITILAQESSIPQKHSQPAISTKKSSVTTINVNNKIIFAQVVELSKCNAFHRSLIYSKSKSGTVEV